MAIVEEDLEQLRAMLVLSDVVQQYVALRRVGRNWVGLCPFHAERSGSFNVRDETGRYRCFGCGAAGDVFKTELAKQLAKAAERTADHVLVDRRVDAANKDGRVVRILLLLQQLRRRERRQQHCCGRQQRRRRRLRRLQLA